MPLKVDETLRKIYILARNVNFIFAYFYRYWIIKWNHKLRKIILTISRIYSDISFIYSPAPGWPCNVTCKPNSLLPATVICLPLLDEMTSRVLIELNIAWQTHVQNSWILMIQTEDIELFLPRNDSSPVPLPTEPSTLAQSAITQSSNFSTSNVTRAGPNVTLESDEKIRKVRSAPRRFSPPRNLSSTMMENLLAIAPLDQR